MHSCFVFDSFIRLKIIKVWQVSYSGEWIYKLGRVWLVWKWLISLMDQLFGTYPIRSCLFLSLETVIRPIPLQLELWFWTYIVSFTSSVCFKGCWGLENAGKWACVWNNVAAIFDEEWSRNREDDGGNESQSLGFELSFLDKLLRNGTFWLP